MKAITNGTVVEVGALIDDSPWGRYAKLVVALGCVALLVEGLENQVISMSIPALMQDWGLERSDFAIVTGAGLLAIAIGTAFGGLLADRYGRRPALLGSVLLFGVMTMLSAASTGPATLSVFRFLAGLGIGGAIPGCLALVSEFTPQRNRSMAIALCLACAPLGALLCSLLTGGILTWFDWRMLYVVQGIIPMLLVLLLFFTLPESPKYLARDPHREGELRTLLRKLGCAVSERTGFCREEAKQRAVSFRDLLSRDIRAETLRLWSAFLFFQMAGYTLISWAPTMLASQGLSATSAALSMGGFYVGCIIGGLVSGSLVDRFGSRAPTASFCAGAIAVALYLGWLPVIGANAGFVMIVVLAAQGFFIAGIANGIYTLASHVYATSMRSTGIGAAATIGRAGAVASSFVGVIALDLGGAAGYFGLIAAGIVISLLSVLLIHNHVPGKRAFTQLNEA